MNVDLMIDETDNLFFESNNGNQQPLIRLVFSKYLSPIAYN